MVCKITARVTVPRLSGQIQGPPKLQGSVALGAPIVDGWYSGGVRQTRQFQQVLEGLRIQHQPEHWASWALDGSLEEDGGRFPLLMQGGWEWVGVGPRKAVRFDGSNNAGLYYGTDEDFQWVHEERVFTIGAWVLGAHVAASNGTIIGTNAGAGTTQTGFQIFIASGAHRLDVFTTSLQRLSGPRFIQDTSTEGLPVFLVTRADGVGFYENSPNATYSTRIAITAPPIYGAHSYNPLSIGYQSTNTIWNCFATSHILTDAEIYRLYVAGMADLMG